MPQNRRTTRRSFIRASGVTAVGATTLTALSLDGSGAAIAETPPAFVPADADFQKDARWLKTYTAGLVDTNRSIYKDGLGLPRKSGRSVCYAAIAAAAFSNWVGLM